MRLDWDDLRFFLAVIEHGSTKRGAAALHVDQTTCARRIASLEAALGLELFAKETGRYLPTRQALELVATAKAMQSAANLFRDQAESHRRKLRGKLRVTTEDTLARQIVTPAVTRFLRLHPDVHVEIDVSTDLRDLHAGEADVAVRGGLEPSDARLVRLKVADDPFGFYCAWTYPSPPTGRADLPGHTLGCFDVVLPQMEAGLAPFVKHVTNSANALRTLIHQGDAVGLLPKSVADDDPPLRLCFEVPVATSIWVLYPERLRGSAHVLKLARMIANQKRQQSPVSG